MTVSIIVPVYNCGKFLDKCIESISNQSYKDIQIILIDDGSTDGSGGIADKWAEKDNRIVIIHQKNSGVCVARNNGLDKATGEYITFVDGDDYLDADYIGKMIEAAQKNDSDLVISGFLMEREDGTIESTLVADGYKKDIDEMWAYRLSAACGRMYSRSLWLDNNIRFTLQKGVRGEDVPIALLTNYTAKNIVAMNYAGYHYIQHEGSAMSEFVGLRKHGFPFDAMDELASKLDSLKETNSKEFFDFGILKFFAQFYFYMGRGADKEVKASMYKYFKEFVYTNCPDYKKSWKYVKRHSDINFVIKVAIQLFVMKLAIR